MNKDSTNGDKQTPIIFPIYLNFDEDEFILDNWFEKMHVEKGVQYRKGVVTKATNFETTHYTCHRGDYYASKELPISMR